MLNRLQQLQTGGDRSLRLGRILLKAFGLMFLLYGVFSLASEAKMGQDSVQVTGKIFDVREIQKDNREKYAPVIEFATRDGRIVHFQGAATTTKPVIDSSITVLYETDKPEQARIDSFTQRWLIPCISTPIGALLLLATRYWRHV